MAVVPFKTHINVSSPVHRDVADPREDPTFTLQEASLYLGIPSSTLRSWTRGRTYPTKEGRKKFAPLIELADPINGLMSFANLGEAHVLQATRDREIPIPAIRKAIDYLQKEWPSKHPLISQDFHRFGRQLFIKTLEQAINISNDGQLGLKPILDQCLERLERDKSGYPIRIFPLHTKKIVLDVYVASGQPVIDGTRVLASVLAGRHEAGDSVDTLMRAYKLKKTDVKEALKHFKTAA